MSEASPWGYRVAVWMGEEVTEPVQGLTQVQCKMFGVLFREAEHMPRF